MKTLTTMTRCLALAVTLCAGAGLAASAQTITLNGSATAAANATSLPTAGSPGYACVNYSAASPLSNEQTFVFTPGANNEVIDKWTLQGDGQASTGSTGTTFKFHPTGFGKARVTVSYYYTSGTQPVMCGGTQLSCNGVPLTTPIRSYATKSFDFFKIFTQAQAGYIIKGPTCVPANNPSVVYSIAPPVIAQVNQIQAGIGIDTYTWTAVYTSGPSSGLPLTLDVSGDGTTAVVDAAQLTGSFNLQVKVGKCNAANPPLAVTVAPDLGGVNALSNFPTCLAVGLTTKTFQLNTVANVAYTLSTSVGTISPASIAAGPAGTTNVTISGLTATNVGNITITGVGNGGTCFGTQTIIRPITRQLVAAQNSITPSSCVPPSTAGVVFTLSNAPAGVVWTVPAGWTITSQTTNTVTVTTGAAGGTISAQAGTCNVGGTGIISRTIGVSGPIANCTFTIANADPGNPGCSFNATAVGSCPTNNGNKYVAWRLYDTGSATPNVPIETVNVPTAFQSTASISFAYQSSIMGTARVEVDVVNTATGGSCLKATYSTQGLDFVYCPTGGRSALGTGSAQQIKELRAYPNPAGGLLQVDLTLTKGTAKLTLLDAVGKVQQTATTTKAHSTLDVSNLADGIYTLRVELPNGKVLTQAVQVRH